jgi:hypothetical protein
MSEATIEKTAKHGPVDGQRPTSACISAPSSVDTSSIRKALKSKGVTPFSLDELDLPGKNLTEILREGARRADLFVGVVDPASSSDNVFFEVGFAQAMEKPTVVLLMKDAPTGPWLASGIPYFRFDPKQLAQLDFAITQALAIPPHEATAPSTSPRRTRPLGGEADEMLAELRAKGEQITGEELEGIVARAIRASGVTSVAEGRMGPELVDLVVWSDDLSPWVGNPLAVAFHRELRRGGDVNAAVAQLLQGMAQGSMPSGLLIYLSSPIDVESAIVAPNVFSTSAEDLLGALRTTGFGALIRQLRIRRAHGAA